MRHFDELVRFSLVLMALQLVSSCGGGNSEPVVPHQVASLALFAGNVAGSGSLDGTGAAASFREW
jgi:hypothetical protein